MKRAFALIAMLGMTGCAMLAPKQEPVAQPAQAATSMNEANQRINAALKAGDYVSAFDQAKAAAEQGDLDAQGLLGGMYYEGMGTPQNITEAQRWWQVASERNDPISQAQLGLLYVKAEQYPAAKFWLEHSAAQGNAQGMFNLGVMYLQGKGMPKDIAMAKSLFTQAAAKGHEKAQQVLKLLP